MMNKIRKYIALIFAALLFVSCSNLVEAVNEPDKPAQKKVVSSVKGECYVSFNLEEPTTEPSTARTVLPDYNYDNCLFKLFGTRGDEAEVLLLNKVSYNDLIKAKNVSVKSGTWTFTVECYDSNDKKILSGTSIPVNITSRTTTIQIPMTFITGTAGSIEVSLSFPSGTDIATVASVKAGLYNSPLAAAGDSCVSLDITNNGETSSVTYSASNLESGLTKYVKFFIYSEAGVELGHYTEAVIIGDNLTSRKKDLSLSTLRSANVLTLTLKTNGSTYTGEEKTGLVLKTFPNEEFAYPMAKVGSNDTYSAKIVNGTKYILYDGEYNTKLIFIPTASETSDGIVEYCDSFDLAGTALAEGADGKTTAGIGLIITDTETESLNDYSSGIKTFYDSVTVRKDKVSLNLENCTGVKYLAWYFFERISQLLSLSYPPNVESISELGNQCLAALFINEGQKNIDFGWSWGETLNLEYLYIPSTAEKINCSVLGNGVKLKNIVIPDSNEYYMSDGERIMTKDGKTLLSWPSVIGAVEIPEGITSIDSGAFCNNTRITDISLPSTLEKIGDQVFSGCSTLRNVNIPEGVTSIGDSAFSSCSNLKSMDIPKSVTSIGNSAFCYCTKLREVNIPDSVTSIGYGAFSECESLEKIVIPSSIKKLGDTDTENGGPGIGVFERCTALKNVVLQEGLEEIGANTFYNCYNLKTIEIPASVTKFCTEAFGWSGLTSINVPEKVEYIGSYCFAGTKIKTLVIPDSVEYIGSGAFQRIKSDSIILSKSIEKIENYLFKEAEIESLIIPDNVKSIGYEAFRESKITSIVIPDKVESIGESAFLYTKITSITFPASVNSIGRCAFYGVGIKNLVIPNTVKSIGDLAFAYCDELETVSIESGVTNIGKNPFSGCTGIKSLNISSENTVYVSENNCIYTKDKKKLIYWDSADDTEITIPGTVVELGDYACSNLVNVTKINLPSSLTTIRYGAFYECRKLTGLDIPNTVTVIEGQAFRGCSALEGIKLPPKLSRINENLFYETTFKKLTIPKNVSYFDYSTLNMSKIEDLYFEEGRTTIYGDNGCFRSGNLKAVYFPKSLTSIQGYYFDYNNNLTDIYYAGTEEQWNNINIYNGNTALQNKTMHYEEVY